ENAQPPASLSRVARVKLRSRREVTAGRGRTAKGRKPAEMRRVSRPPSPAVLGTWRSCLVGSAHPNITEREVLSRPHPPGTSPRQSDSPVTIGGLAEVARKRSSAVDPPSSVVETPGIRAARRARSWIVRPVVAVGVQRRERANFSPFPCGAVVGNVYALP